MRVGLIGAGRIGRLHGENLLTRLRGIELARVADPHVDAAREWAEGFGLEQVDADPEAIFSDPSLDAVLVCSSTDTHAEFVTRAAQAGKHVFCEKPVDLDPDRIREAMAAVTEAGVTLQVGFNRRFDHNFRALRRSVEEGRIGAPHLLRITSHDPAPPPAGYVAVSGGIFLDMTIHDFDMARFLVGSEVVEVYAQGAVRIDPAIGEAGDVDTAVTCLRFADGTLGVIENSRRACYGYDQRAELLGSLGCARTGNDLPSTLLVGTEQGVVAEKPLHFFLERYQRSFLDELRAFADAVTRGEPAPVTGEDGLRATLIGLAARRSLELGGPVPVAQP